MSNFKKELSNYQIIPRELIFDPSLTDRARFVYCFMASKPDDWDFYLEPMANEIGYSKDTLRKYINELVSNGWLVKGEQVNNNGVFGAVEYTLKASKLSKSEVTVSENFRCGKNPTLHNRDYIENIDIVDSSNIYNKEKDITKVISKKKEPKESSAKEKVNEDFEKFKEFINKHAPRVAKMQRPFTLEEFIDIKEKYNNKVVRDVLINMDNYRDLNKNISAYRTLCNWINRNEKSNTNHSADSTPTKEAPKNGGFKRILNAEDD